jgi:PhzF family phenazine biosynthesis protein
MSRQPFKIPVLRYAAFTLKGMGDNPAGVVLDAKGLDGDACRAIAAELNYSETVFVESRTSVDRAAQSESVAREFDVRYFSPLAQVAFCGHATIAAAVALAERDEHGPLVFHTLSGPISIETRRGHSGTTATLMSPPTSTAAADSEDVEETLRALRWRASDLDPRYPPHVSFAGNQHLVVAAASRERLANLDYKFDALASLMARRQWTTVHLVFAERPDLFHARDPFPPGGVVEDSATGAAAAAFGGYLRSLGLVEAPARVTILQGEDMGRPCELLIDIPLNDDRVAVTGVAVRLIDDDG